MKIYRAFVLIEACIDGEVYSRKLRFGDFFTVESHAKVQLEVLELTWNDKDSELEVIVSGIEIVPALEFGKV